MYKMCKICVCAQARMPTKNERKKLISDYNQYELESFLQLLFLFLIKHDT